MIRVGVVGLGRGVAFVREAASETGLELVALCDTWEERLSQAGETLGVATYVDYDEFLGHDMDAVVLANYFHQHAPFAIRALRAGKHVMSETTACKTMAEGVALVQAVEESGRIYMLAENYPYMAFNQEMRRLYDQGEVGRVVYAEAEYVHPFSAEGFNAIAPGEDHWRNWLPLIYYCTHAIAPVMYITGTWPVAVNGFSVPYDPDDPSLAGTARRADPAGVLMLRMDNGAVVRALQGTLRGGSVGTRIHGTRGAMESLRYGEQGAIWVRHEPWELRDGELPERCYVPQLPEHARHSGHGGGDFFTAWHFAEAIRSGQQPFFDVYRAVAMAACGILGYRSALEGSAPIAIPDLRSEAARSAFAEDHWSPDPADAGPGQPWPSILGDIRPSEDGLAGARETWRTSAVLYGEAIDAMLAEAARARK